MGRSLAKHEADGRQSRETKTREQFCAHPLCHRLMGITDEQILAERDKPGFEAPAMVRISFGMYNTDDEVDVLVKAIQDLAS